MTMSYTAFQRSMTARGTAIVGISPAGIDSFDLINGYPRGELRPEQVFVFIEGDDLLCRKADAARLTRAMSMSVRLWRHDGLEKDTEIPWRVQGTDDIDEAVEEAADEIHRLREAAGTGLTDALESDSFMDRAMELLTGTRALLQRMEEEGEEDLIRKRVVDKMTQRQEERALRKTLRSRHSRKTFFLCVSDERTITSAAKARSGPRDIQARYDGRNTLGCAADRVEKLARLIRRTYGRSSKLVAVSDADFDAADTGMRLEEKAIEWATFKKQLDTFKQGRLQIKVLIDGPNKGKIGYIQKHNRAEGNAEHYDYIPVRLARQEGAYTLHCHSSTLKALQKAMRRTFAAKAGQVTLDTGY